MELTVVILVLLFLTALLLIGASGWKSGTDRARCIMNIRNMQMSVRAYTSASPYQAGTDLSLEVPPVHLLAELAGPGR